VKVAKFAMLDCPHRLIMAKELFGTDGIRGIPGAPPLDDATLYATGRGVSEYLKRHHGSAHVLIGMDTRESGPHIAALLAAGLQRAGATAEFAGVITTPGVACLVRQNDYHAGVVISASHNPFHDNGVKLFSHAGMKFPDVDEEKIEEEIFRVRSAEVPAWRPALVANHELHVEYLDFLKSHVLSGANLSGFRVVLDCEWCRVSAWAGVVPGPRRRRGGDRCEAGWTQYQRGMRFTLPGGVAAGGAANRGAIGRRI